MQLRPADISIAVTVYRRLDYLEQALESATRQTVPVRVQLYDDGCDDLPRLRKILEQSGGDVEYHRNPRTLGLFGAMNAALAQAPTPWISILHDDDKVAPDFVERILEAASEVERCALFFGGTVYLTPEGVPFHQAALPPGTGWRQITPEEFAFKTWFAFPGQLIHAPTARRVGGFPPKSVYTGDWDLWFRLAMTQGAVQVEACTGLHRAHLGADRGTTTAAKTGRKSALCAMQVKRNLARLRQAGYSIAFDRKRFVRAVNPLYQDLLNYSASMPAWLLRYNRRLLLFSEPESRAMRTLQRASKWLGNPVLRAAGRAHHLAVRLGLRAARSF